MLSELEKTSLAVSTWRGDRKNQRVGRIHFSRRTFVNFGGLSKALILSVVNRASLGTYA